MRFIPVTLEENISVFPVRIINSEQSCMNKIAPLLSISALIISSSLCIVYLYKYKSVFKKVY